MKSRRPDGDGVNNAASTDDSERERLTDDIAILIIAEWRRRQREKLAEDISSSYKPKNEAGAAGAG